MTFNVISDIHCSSTFINGEHDIIWNLDSQKLKKTAEDDLKLLIELLKDDKEKKNILTNVKKNLRLLKNNKISECKSLSAIFNDFVYNFTQERLIRSYEFFLLYQNQNCEFIPEKLHPADYLIVCGDLGLDTFYHKVYQELKYRTRDLFKDVFYIKGNHDYWWFKDGDIEKPDSINLDHRYVENVIDDYVFLGCTMWSPIYMAVYSVSRAMNDYRHIPHYSIEKTNQLHKEESEWLRNKVHYYKSLNKKVIVFTHHIPRQELINKKYKNSDINEAYYVMDHSCDDIKPDVWCTGHAHTYHDTVIDGVRYVCNPIGYRSHYGYVIPETDPTHWYNTIVTL